MSQAEEDFHVLLVGICCSTVHVSLAMDWQIEDIVLETRRLAPASKAITKKPRKTSVSSDIFVVCMTVCGLCLAALHVFCL